MRIKQALVCAILPFLACVLCCGKTVSALVEQKVDISLTVYDPPLLVGNNVITSPGDVPDWYPAFIAPMKFVELSFEEFRALLSDEYSEKMGVSRSKFAELQDRFTIEDIKVEAASIISARSITLEGRELLFVEYQPDLLLLDQKSAQELDMASFVELEKIDGIWKRQTGESIGWVQFVGIMKHPDLQEILDEGRFVFPETKVIVPYSRF